MFRDYTLARAANLVPIGTLACGSGTSYSPARQVKEHAGNDLNFRSSPDTQGLRGLQAA